MNTLEVHMLLEASRVAEIVKACVPTQIPDEVLAPLRACLAKNDIEGARAVAPHLRLVEGIRVLVMALEVEKLEMYRTEVEAMLHELSPTFWTGGDSFLNACSDKDGRQWGEHSNCEELLLLGSGLGLVQCLFPRARWSILPGGMPYYRCVSSKWVCADCVRAVAEVLVCPHCGGRRIALRTLLEDALGHTIEAEATAQATK